MYLSIIYTLVIGVTAHIGLIAPPVRQARNENEELSKGHRTLRCCAVNPMASKHTIITHHEVEVFVLGLVLGQHPLVHQRVPVQLLLGPALMGDLGELVRCFARRAGRQRGGNGRQGTCAGGGGGARRG